MWQVDEDSLESIAIGAGILGTGGGGDPYVGLVLAREALRRNGPVTVLSPEELAEDARVVGVALIGAPTVAIEKVPDIQASYAFRALEQYTGKLATALISLEIGGINSVLPLVPAAMAGLPVVDADGVGRAFPQLQMMTFSVYGGSLCPLAVSDEKGNTVVIPDALDSTWVERLARALCIQMGCIAAFAMAPMSASQVLNTGVLHTLSLARDLGNSVKRARQRQEDPIDAILEACPGTVLFQGKVVDVDRRTTGGWSQGKVTIAGLGAYDGEHMEIDFQNENLIARREGRVVCTVPDLICVVDTERGEPITTELLRYGFRVTVLGMPAPRLWTTFEGLEVAGPRALGYDLDYTPVTL